MHLSSSILVIFSVLSCVFGAHIRVGKKVGCEREINDTEIAFKKTLFLSNELKIPKTVAELDTYCRASKESVRAIRKASSCFGPFPKQLFTIMAATSTKILAQLCGKKANKSDTLHKVRCYNRRVVDKMYNCMDDLTKQLDFIATNVSDSDIFPHLCCSLHSLSECMYQKTLSACEVGKEEGANFIKNLFEQSFADASTFMCGKSPSLTHCTRSEASVMRNLNQAREGGFRNPSRTFFVGPLVDVAERLVE